MTLTVPPVVPAKGVKLQVATPPESAMAAQATLLVPEMLWVKSTEPVGVGPEAALTVSVTVMGLPAVPGG